MSALWFYLSMGLLFAGAVLYLADVCRRAWRR